MTWFLSLFSAHRNLQQERDDALREAGYYRAQAERWEARCEKAREELMDTLRGVVAPPTVEPPQGEGWRKGHEQLPDRQLEEFLGKAAVVGDTEVAVRGRRIRILELERLGLHLRAVFQFVEEAPEASPGAPHPRRFLHEVAAYWLDRRLGLRLVPVTVERKIDGQRGALSIFLEGALDVRSIRAYDLWKLAEGLELQMARARIFSALVGTRDRDDAAKMLLPLERRVMIADNSLGFPLTTGFEDLLADEVELEGREPGQLERFTITPCARLDAGFYGVLDSLGEEELRRRLGGYLSRAQIEALLLRRDRILEVCSTRAAS